MSIERVLHVLRLEADLGLAEAARAWAQAGERHGAAQSQVARLEAAEARARAELCRLLEARVVNPAGHALVRRLWQSTREQLLQARDTLRAAAHELEARHDELAQARRRESGLADAVRSARKDAHRESAGREQHAADDAWLQTHWSSP